MLVLVLVFVLVMRYEEIIASLPLYGSDQDPDDLFSPSHEHEHEHEHDVCLILPS